MRLPAFLLMAGVCLAFAVLRLEVRTSITEFLPHDERSRLLELARELSNAPQSRGLVITLSAADTESHVQAATKLRERLLHSGLFEWVRGGLVAAEREKLFQVMFPARLGLLDLPGDSGPVPSEWLRARLEQLKARLASPLGMLERRLAPADPLGSFAGLLERQQQARGRLTLHGEQLVTADGRWSVLFAATKAAAFQAQAQGQVVHALESSLAALKSEVKELRWEWTGLNRFALDGEASVRGDVERISSLSLAGIFLLYLLVFRSLREPLVVLVPVALGCALAVAVCQLTFGFVHGLTLAFGSSIIGVAEDYSTHFLTHRVSTPGTEDNEHLMRRLWPGMLMGGVTTVTGLLALAVSGFPGLQQMALFGAVGVFGALVSTRWLLPVLSRREGRVRSRVLGRWGDALVRALSFQPTRALWLLGPVILLCVLGLPRLVWRDGLSALRTPAPQLDAESQRVQARLGRRSGGRLVVALGHSDEDALKRAERGRVLLERARAQGLVQDFRTPVALLPSVGQQKHTRERLTTDPSFWPRFGQALVALGFVPSAFGDFRDELANPKPVFLTPEQLLQSGLRDMVAPYRAALTDGIAYLTPVEVHGAAREPDMDTERSAALEQMFEGESQLFYVDQEALFNAAYARFRERASSLVLLGLALVLGTLLVRYRSFETAALGMLPALLGAGAALGVQALCGIPATLMHVIAILLVLSMGVDYGIYMLESRDSLQEGVVTLGSVLLAALTTLLSFGLLGLSRNPALSGIGLTVTLGLLFSVLVSPVVLVWARKDPR